MSNQNEKIVRIDTVSPEDVLAELYKGEKSATGNGSHKEKTRRLSRLIRIRNKKINILLVGSTGSGKNL